MAMRQPSFVSAKRSSSCAGSTRYRRPQKATCRSASARKTKSPSARTSQECTNRAYGTSVESGSHRRGAPPCSGLQAEIELPGPREALRDVLPVPEVPDGGEVLVLVGLVLQVVGVLPAVEDEERHAPLRDLVLVVVDLRRPEPLDDRIPHQRGPPRSH